MAYRGEIFVLLYQCVPIVRQQVTLFFVLVFHATKVLQNGELIFFLVSLCGIFHVS